jgi:hypothetical protein
LVASFLNNNGKQTEVTQDYISSNKTIKQGQTFTKFSEFQEQFKKYCAETFQLFIISKSTSLNDNDEDDQENENIESDNETEVCITKTYKSCTYYCIRNSLRNKTKTHLGAGINPLTRFNGCGCKTYININLQACGPSIGLYKIT